MKDTIVSPPDVRQGPDRLRTLRTKRRPIPHSETIFSCPHNPLPILSHSAPAESRYGRFRHSYPKLPPKQEETALIRKPRHPSTDARWTTFADKPKSHTHPDTTAPPAIYRIRNAEKVYDHKKDVSVRTETGQPAHIAGRGNKTDNHDARTKSPRKQPAATSFNDPKFRRRSTARSDSPSRPAYSFRSSPAETGKDRRRKAETTEIGTRKARSSNPLPKGRTAYQFIGSRPMLLR